MKRFDGKTMVVTGAGSGIGAACVRRLFEEGASVVAADVRKEDVNRVVAEFGGSDRIYAVGVDVSISFHLAPTSRRGWWLRCNPRRC